MARLSVIEGQEATHTESDTHLKAKIETLISQVKFKVSLQRLVL